MVYTSEYESEEFLHINSCDCQHLSGRNVGSLREKGRVDYHILFITEGALFIKENGEEIKVPKGNIVIYRPFEVQNYYVKAEINTTSYYVHFSGTEAGAFLEKFNLSGRVIPVGDVPLAEEIFKKMIEEYYLKRTFSNEISSGYMYTLLGLFGRRASGESFSHSEGRIDAVCRDMIMRFDEEFSLEEYATMCNLSVGRFSHLFKNCTGKSPKGYILEIRLEKAKELLENTDLSVKRVGEKAGFSDQNYFSRIFKKYVKKSPFEYRKSFN